MLLGFVFQSPGPILWEIGSLSVRWYGFLIAMAVLLGVTLSQYLAQKRAIDPDLIADFAIWLVVGAIPAPVCTMFSFSGKNTAAKSC
jgi:phosphatidylglycerol:prolipoprotein diacylglycerol transferase